MLTEPLRETHADAFSDVHRAAPYVEALRSLAGRDLQRLHVPAHHGAAANANGLVDLVGERGLAMDFPMLLSGIDQQTWRSRSGDATPLMQAQRLAADAWGASRAWFLTNGASSGNHIAGMVVRGLGLGLVVQRSVHSSVIAGVAHAGVEPHFVHGSVDVELGSSHGVTADQVARALQGAPDSAAVYLVSPSYFGAVADIADISAVVHAHGIPLIVDEAWGAHFGFHPGLPVNAVRLGADLVISSTHKGAGSLTQSAMLLLGHGDQARRIESLVDRVHRSYQSTSCSAILLASLDEARRRLVVDGDRLIGETLAAAERIRTGIRAGGRFTDATPRILDRPDAVAHDPFKIVIGTRSARIGGGEAQFRLLRDHGVSIELSTPSAIVLLLGATSTIDVDRVLDAIHALPEVPESLQDIESLPAIGPRRMPLSDAFFSPTEVVGHQDAVGRISADTLAAYPPGIPNVLPGEELTPGIVRFLRATATSPSGYVRGAVDRALDAFRVVAS